MREFFKKLYSNKIIFAGVIILALALIFLAVASLHKYLYAISMLCFAAFSADCGAWFIFRKKKIKETNIEEFIPLEEKELSKVKTKRGFKKADFIMCATVFFIFAFVITYYALKIIIA